MSSSEHSINGSVPAQTTTMDKPTSADPLLPQSDTNDASCTPKDAFVTAGCITTTLLGGVLTAGVAKLLFGTKAAFFAGPCGAIATGLGVGSGLVCQDKLHEERLER
jgi:hypothetical protein